jgi:hypothetical protein
LAVDEPDGLINGIDAYREIIRGNIEYECLAECGHYRRAELDELVEIMADAAATVKDYITIGGEPKPSQNVRSVLLKLTPPHIEYVMERMAENTTEIHNIRAYLLTALYNAPQTIDHHYRSRVNHDLYGVPQ